MAKELIVKIPINVSNLAKDAMEMMHNVGVENWQLYERGMLYCGESVDNAIQCNAISDKDRDMLIALVEGIVLVEYNY